MRTFLLLIDDFLRGQGCFAVEAPVAGRIRWLVILPLVFGGLYGVVMGSFGVFATGAPRLFAYTALVAVKVPLFMLVTFVLCLPFFFVVNSVAGLRDDFAQALRATLATLACQAVVLAALAPVTAFFYCCTTYYDAAILFNGAVFAVASFASAIVLRRYYGPLIRRAPAHRRMVAVWLAIYIFVAIQMAWTLRPFIGDPNPLVPIVLFRSGEIDNAYLEVVRLFRQVFQTWL